MASVPSSSPTRKAFRHAGADIGAMAELTYMDAYKSDIITRNRGDHPPVRR